MFPVSAAGATVVSIGGLVVLAHPEWLVAFPVAYICIWLGIKLPFSGWLQKTDISYGVYIYGYPIAMLLFVYGVPRYGAFVYAGLTFLIVIPLAAESWFGVEQRAMRLKDAGRRSEGDGIRVSAGRLKDRAIGIEEPVLGDEHIVQRTAK